MLLRCLRGTLVLAVLVVPWRVTFAVDAPRFLVFHLDAVSACVFEAALAEGRLPNIVRAFEGGTYRHAVTLFPASTPMIYPRLHTGECNASGAAVGFGGFDRARDRPIHEVEVFLGLVEALPRRAVATIVYGVPGMDVLATLAMQNLPGLLERHEVVEFMWFSTDAYGHLYGADAHARSLDRFDAALGQLLPHIDLERTNLILYADHGLTFCSDTVDLEALYAARVGVDLRHAAYPNLYLHDPGAAARVAAALAADGGVDFAFFRAAPGRVEGYVDGRWLAFVGAGDGVAYRSHDDPLGYAELGYDGASLTPEAWLGLTGEARYPATPANIYRYLQHPGSGDVVAGVNPPRIPRTVRANCGNHAGLVASDLVVPVLTRGPDLAHIAGDRPIWLHQLYDGVDELTEARPQVREAHAFGVAWRLEDASAVAHLTVSPGEGRRLVLEADRERWQTWAEVDVLSTYLTRWWLGAGVAYQPRVGAVHPMACATVELDLADARVSVEATYTPGRWTVGVGLRLRLVDGWRVWFRSPTTVGIGFEW
jgi:hypothetical protein